MPRVFFITGASRGLGQALARALLDAGEYVVATARDPSALAFTSATADNYLPLKLDVTSASDIEAAFDAALAKFSRIDVVVNNAAYGLVGPLETLTDVQIRHQFDVNFFSVASITRRAVNVMRTQSPPGGMIVQVSTVATLIGFPMLGAMGATKRAVEALTESVQQELKPEWGIKLVSVKPDAMDTEAHERSMVYGEKEDAAYDHMNGRAWVASLSALPAVKAAKVAQAIYAVTKMEDPPMNAVLGNNVREMAKTRLKNDEEMLFREDLLEVAKISSNQ